MRTTARKLGLLTGALALLVAAPAMAQQATFGEPEPEQPIFGFTGFGIYAGGGVADFVDGDMRDFTDVGGAWDVRAVINNRGLIGVEIGYMGSAQDIEALGLDDDSVLLGTMVEANGRINVLPQQNFTPYVIGGAGYTRYDITNSDFNTSNVRDDDQMLSVPVGGGVGFKVGSALIDVRGTYRFMFDDNLVDAPAEPGIEADDISQDNWSATARLGFEF